MHEGVAGAGVRGQLAGAGELQALDDRGFAGAVGANDEGEGLEEGDDVLVLRIEAPDPLDQHLVHRAHLALPLLLLLLTSPLAI